MVQQVMQLTILEDQEKWKTISSKQKLKVLFESLEAIAKYEC